MTKLVETEIPDWAEWMAQDFSGVWMVFECEPIKNARGGLWISPGKVAGAGFSGKTNPNWRDTLYKLEEK